MQFETEILIIGGGLAGLISALHLQKFAINVTLIEKNSYPHHKVCGEYISNEVLPYLNWLGLDLQVLGSSSITDLQFTTLFGASVITKLPLGGFGISRYTLDNFLYKEATRRGINVIFDTVSEVHFNGNSFNVETIAGRNFKARQVIGAFGKRSVIDVKLNRDFIHKKSPYLAVKAHFAGSFPDKLVALHNFSGGYCGVSKIESDKLNVCYLANYQSFKQHKNIDSFQENVLYKNHFLKDIFENSEMIFESPLTIGQISFTAKKPVQNHILMVGDTAGLIHPLCGNGMAMAIHSAKIASELLVDFFNNESYSREELEKNYTKLWNFNFSSRLKTGRILSSVLQNNVLQKIAFSTVTKIPGLLSNIIKSTHGKPISIAQ